MRRPAVSSAPPYRRLRVYAADPYLHTRPDLMDINSLTLPVRWEGSRRTGTSTLKAGPVGEYLEVVDYDPASACFYAPVDLDDPLVLAQDGLDPSEGNPQFHQQMVYAVAMNTLHNFELALGRTARWCPRRKGGTWHFVPRLRLYPHALRQANAFYSREKRALLFGYFPASGKDPGRCLPGGTVFTCLSHDVIAHETSHALLDGIHARFLEPTNLDVYAFHEAFADLVAMLQHFTFPRVLRHQIARTRGDLAKQSLLGELAQEIGLATGQYGALRSAIGTRDLHTNKWRPKPPDPKALRTTEECHERGAILVAAVFDAFLTIYKQRIADLLRIATGGTGVLPAGDLHPDLVNRLSDEAAKAANHLLRMCIRALDYCPPVDITFGEYLRALVTADYELVRDDDLHYRVAVIDSFRKYGIYPLNVRDLSEDTLRWRPPEQLKLDWDAHFRHWLGDRTKSWRLTGDRRTAFAHEEQCGRALHRWLDRQRHTLPPEQQQELGLDLTGARWQQTDLSDLQRKQLSLAEGPPDEFEVHSVRPAWRAGPDGQQQSDLVVEITQQRQVAETESRFRGGCTLILDLETGQVRCCISKDIYSSTRTERQQDYQNGWHFRTLEALGQECYGTGWQDEPFALLHGSPRKEMER